VKVNAASSRRERIKGQFPGGSLFSNVVSDECLSCAVKSRKWPFLPRIVCGEEVTAVRPDVRKVTLFVL
jgi:hypothetical protein